MNTYKSWQAQESNTAALASLLYYLPNFCQVQVHFRMQTMGMSCLLVPDAFWCRPMQKNLVTNVADPPYFGVDPDPDQRIHGSD
jgi:hypothetical protein